MFKRIKIKPLGIAVLSILGVFIGINIIIIISPRDKNEGFRYYINKKIGSGCISYKQAIFSRKLRDMLPDYISESGITGIRKCSNKKELLRKALRGEVFKIRNGRGFVVEDLSYSFPYLTREGKILVKEIGKRFRKKISGTRLRGSDFRITSMTRTIEEFHRLRRNNSNASENTPHFYGNAIDISYVRFSAKKWFVTDCDKYYLKEALAEVIWQLREEKKCWATYEINQGCFHVVAR
ncbi:MAG: hypothetical protein QG611_624 [Bacteroidota bacterium]|nr:hypothetical protein [Bacteroidota bacterium]